MRFIVDESTGKAVVDYLQAQGHDVIDVAKEMPQAHDPDILERALKDNRVVISNDKDFGELVFRSRKANHGVLLLRLHDDRPANRVHIVQLVLRKYGDRLPGRFMVASEGGVRSRPIRDRS